MCATKEMITCIIGYLTMQRVDHDKIRQLTPQVVMYGSLNTLLHSGQYSLGDASSANNTISCKKHINNLKVIDHLTMNKTNTKIKGNSNV